MALRDTTVEKEETTSKWQTILTKGNQFVMEHMYSTEDTLFQVIFDKKFRPEIYRLKIEDHKHEELAKRYNDILIKYQANKKIIDLETIKL